MAMICNENIDLKIWSIRRLSFGYFMDVPDVFSFGIYSDEFLTGISLGVFHYQFFIDLDKAK